MKSPETVFLLVFGGMSISTLSVGAGYLFWPKQMWYYRTGWKYKNLEPSELLLVLMRVGGGFLILFGLTLLVVAAVLFRLPIRGVVGA